MSRWILGLTIFAVLAMAGVALAGGGSSGGGRNLETRGACSESIGGALCETEVNAECAGSCKNVDGELGAEAGRGTSDSTRRRAFADRPLDGSGSKRGAGQRQRLSGCQGRCS